MPFFSKRTSPEQFAVLAIATLVGIFAIGAACVVVALRADAQNFNASNTLLLTGGALICAALAGSGIAWSVKQWLD